MKRFFLGVLSGLLIGFIFAAATFSFAATNPIRLIVNDKEVPCDPPPQMIQGRVFVPVRFVSEALGANVEWDQENNAVVITSQDQSVTSSSTSSNERPVDCYTGREIFQAIIQKYPNLKSSSSNLKIEPQKGEYRFLVETGELWLDGQKYVLPKIVINDKLYFSIKPLIDAGMLSSDDIQLLEWDEKEQRVIITPKTPTKDNYIKQNETEERRMLKINGEPTPSLYWEENGSIFVALRPVFEMLQKQQPSLNFTIGAGGFFVDGKLKEPVVEKDGYATINITNLKNAGYLNFTWDNGNLIY